MKHRGTYLTAFGGGCLFSSLIAKYNPSGDASDYLIVIGFLSVLAGAFLLLKAKT